MMPDVTPVGEYDVRLAVTDDDGGTGTSATTATIIYRICTLYEPQRAVRRGSTLPIKIQICDAAGVNRSSPAIPLTVTRIEQVSTIAPGLLADSASTAPENEFRYDPTLGGSGGYILNLSTTGITTGTYVLRFTVGTATYEYGVGFQVR